MKDVCALLRKAIEKRGDIKVEVCAILNDTTGKVADSATSSSTSRKKLTFLLHLIRLPDVLRLEGAQVQNRTHHRDWN